MQTFIHKTILILLCFYGGFHTDLPIDLPFLSALPPDIHLIIVFLVSLILSFLADIVPKNLRYVLYGLFLLFCLKNPHFLCFLPLMLYNILLDFGFASLLLTLLFPLLYPDWFFGVLSLVSLSFAYSERKKTSLSLSNQNLQNDLRTQALYFVQSEHQKEKDIEIAILSERNRIAREIHDAIGHTLSSGILQTEALKLSAPEEMHTAFDTLQQTLQSGMFDIRRSLHHLHSSSLNLRDELTAITKNPQQLSIELDCHLDEDSMDYALKFQLISIVKEAVTNANKHSDATKMTIRISEKPGFYILSIKDNGRTKPDETKPIHLGIGLISLQEFAKKHSGNLSFGFDRGFYIHLTLKK